MRRHLSLSAIRSLATTIISLLLLAACSNINKDRNDNIRLLLGSYDSGDKERIQLFSFNQATGEAEYICGLSGIEEASFVSLAPDGKHFYAVSERDDSLAALYAAEITEGDTVKMRIINSQLTEGAAPCYINIEQNGLFAYTANYNGSSFTMFDIDPATGALLPDTRVERFIGTGPIAGHQEKSHIHCIEFTPDSAFLLANDLGADVIHVFPVVEGEKDKKKHIDGKNSFDVPLEAGSGPRHITFAHDGKHGYLINELSGKVTVIEYKDKNLRPVQYVVSDNVGAHGSADIHISPDGLYLYASNRLKADGISIFSIDQGNGHITKIGYQLTGVHPRNFAITPNGRYLLCACRDSNTIQIFERNIKTGLLKDTGRKIEMEKPVCVKYI